MALIFPFDESLKGYVEKITLRTANLTYPIFTFPKGSFFVENTFGRIPDTNDFLRPGIDYIVLSLNKDIPYSDNQALNNKLKQHYVRNAILLKNLSITNVEWTVAYCGGEDEIKPSEYANLVSGLYNEAKQKGKLNILTTDHQAWGGYPDIDNRQYVSGSNINSYYFRDKEEREEFDGTLSWGKVEMSLQSLAETVTAGNDPLIIKAVQDWVRHNADRYKEYQESLEEDLDDKIKNLDDKRISSLQYVHGDHNPAHTDQHFKLRHGVTLRGIDPSKESKTTAETIAADDPINTGRETPGFYGTMGEGIDGNIKHHATKIWQRVDSYAQSKSTKLSVVMNQNRDSRVGEVISLLIKGGVDDLALYPYGAVAYIISSKANRVIGKHDITEFLTRTNHTHDVNIDTTVWTELDYTESDIWHLIVVGKNIDSPIYASDTLSVFNPNSSEGWEVYINNFDSIVVQDESIPVIDQEHLSLTIRRKRSDGEARLRIGWVIPNAITGNGVIGITSTTFLNNSNENHIRVRVPAFNPLIGNRSLLLVIGSHPNLDKIFKAIPIALREVGLQQYAQLQVVNFDGEPTTVIESSGIYYLDVTYSKSFNFFAVNPVLRSGQQSSPSIDLVLGSPEIISSSNVRYPLLINGSSPTTTTFDMWLEDVNNPSFGTNRVTTIFKGGKLPTIVGNGRRIHTTKYVSWTNDGEWIKGRIKIVPDSVVNPNILFSVKNFKFNPSDVEYPQYVNSSNDGSIRMEIRIRKSAYDESKMDWVILSDFGQIAIDSGELVFDEDKLNQVTMELLDDNGKVMPYRSLEWKVYYNIRVTNNHSSHTVVISKDVYDQSLNIASVSLIGNVSDTPVTIGPGESKLITTAAGIRINDIRYTNAQESNQPKQWYPPISVKTLDRNGDVLSVKPYVGDSFDKYTVVSLDERLSIISKSTPVNVVKMGTTPTRFTMAWKTNKPTTSVSVHLSLEGGERIAVSAVISSMVYDPVTGTNTMDLYALQSRNPTQYTYDEFTIHARIFGDGGDGVQRLLAIGSIVLKLEKP